MWIKSEKMKHGQALNKRQQNDSTGNPSSFCSIEASEVHFWIQKVRDNELVDRDAVFQKGPLFNYVELILPSIIDHPPTPG